MNDSVYITLKYHKDKIIPDMVAKNIIFKRIISLTTGKMGPVVAWKMESTTNLSIICHTLKIFECCKKSEYNFRANRKFTSCYNINIFNSLWERMLFPHGIISPAIKGYNSCKRSILESNSEMCKWSGLCI